MYSHKSHNFYAFKCPYCSNFFKSRIDSVKTGKVKSCGCLKREKAKLIGKANKKHNKYYFPLNYDFGICFYNNFDDYFIFDTDKYELIKEHNWLAKKSRNRIEPCTNLNGSLVLLSRFLMNTPKGMECDHINRCPNDNRMCNLRNGTKLQNLMNKEVGQGVVHEDASSGKYKIKFPKGNIDDLIYHSEEEATNKLYELQDKYYGEFSFRKSNQIAQKYKINHPKEDNILCTGVLDEIRKLPKTNIFNIILESILRNKLNNAITENNETMLLLQLINDYVMNKRTQKEEGLI